MYRYLFTFTSWLQLTPPFYSVVLGSFQCLVTKPKSPQPKPFIPHKAGDLTSLKALIATFHAYIQPYIGGATLLF